MGLVGAFFGSPQSKVSGMIMFIAIIVFSISVIFSFENIPVAQKVGIAFMIFIICSAILLFNLFQLTCLVTGRGQYGETWWCGIYAWIIAIFIILFAILMIVFIIMVFASKDKKVNEKFYIDGEDDDDDEEEE